ncbi:MAG: ABC transporter substrate-binding protein [Ruminococcaceae bacterium]|nr:ABC transporter substrate-binding protein [Oscillospiraceae bacterium]
MMKKRTIRLISFIIVVSLLAMLLPSCSNKEKVYKIGIAKFEAHDAIDRSTEGFRESVISGLGGIDYVEFIEYNIGRDSNYCDKIIKKFIDKDVDLIMANGTGALQSAAKATDSIPILGTSITDFETALDFKGVKGALGKNITGTSDIAPLDEMAKVITDTVPDAKMVGILYCSSESNSDYQVKRMTNILRGNGLSVTQYPFENDKDLSAIAKTAADLSDVIYIPADNATSNLAKEIDSIIRPTGTPVIATGEDNCKAFGVATLAIDYKELGKKTGEMAVDILLGEKNVQDIEIAYLPGPTKKFNVERGNELGIQIPIGYEAF